MWRGRCYVCVTHDELLVQDVANAATDAAGGAISIFVGTTRNSFQNKRVDKLEYEAYEPMAVKCMQVTEASVVIAASAPHRQAAIEACHWIIDELKAVVPIWKKEFFCDGSVWKENAESRLVQQHRYTGHNS
eukprot:jgi/Ulvmu1/12144/UM085_0008.1